MRDYPEVEWDVDHQFAVQKVEYPTFPDSLQEFYDKNFELKKYPYKFKFTRGDKTKYGQVIYSKHPIINKGEIVQCTSKRELLSQLTTETFVFDLCESLPDGFSLEGFEFSSPADETLEVTVEKGQSINRIFTMLTEKGLEVRSMRTKSNRLEELFVNLVRESNS